MDTVQPGFLGSYQAFRDTYIKPILSAPEDEADTVRIEVGEALREQVGGLMLRRNKEDHLAQLPEKHIILGDYNDDGEFIFDDKISEMMQGVQRQRYEDVVNATVVDMDNPDNHGAALGGLQKLRSTSLHPQLLDNITDLPDSPEHLRELLQESGKMRILLRIIDQVQAKDEKVLIFAITQRLQTLVALSLQQIYQTPVVIINGATQAISKNANNPTRQGLIDQFQAKEGFGILVISPVAAGVGLTITAANHVIHLERHWNPAKEAQATDRAYRIGQTKDVYVYIPILTHPDFDSFDVNLNRLLSGKQSLQGAIIVPNEVCPAALMKNMTR